MSDHKSDRHAYCHTLLLSETLGDWEDEGGSILEPSYEDRSDEEHNARHPEPEFALLDAVPLGILITNDDGEITYSNPASQRLYAVSASDLVGTHWCETIDARDRAAVPSRWQKPSDDDRPRMFEVRIVTSSGRKIWTRHSVERLILDQAAGGHIHTIEDISRMKAAEEAGTVALEDLSRERERARVTLESIGDAVISTDAEGRVTYLNPVAEDLTGWSREEASGQLLGQVFKVIDSDTGKLIENPAEQAIESLEIVQMPANCLLLRPDGSELAIEDSAAPILDKGGQLTGAVVIFRDRRLSSENTAKMAHLARHDALTGLPNRVAFEEHCDQALKLARRHHKRVGLLFIDLDQFKRVNDELGHKAGDRLLRDISRKLLTCIRSTDLVCRHGGDEFVVLLGEIRQPEDAARVARKMLATVARPHKTKNGPVGLEISIGISLYPDDGADMETLINQADAAMYHAKFDRETGYCFYREGIQRPMARSHHEEGVNTTRRNDTRRAPRP